MELWRDYKFVKFAKNNIKVASVDYGKFINEYRSMNKLNSDQINDLWDSAVDQKFLETNGLQLRLLHRGRKLTEMYGYGFLVEVIRRYGGPIVLVAGLASIINLVVVLS